MNVCQLQSRSREPGFKSPLRNSTDDLPRYEQKQTNAISFPHLDQNTRQYFRFRPFLRRARLRQSRVTGVSRSSGQVEALGFRPIFSMTSLGKADFIGS
jgi:hypothetical protein